MNQASKVSVVMATYNGAAFLNEQLDSILNQTYPIYEIVISDDCSTDNTWDIILDYMSRFSNIKAYRNNKINGPHSNFIKAFSRAKGDFIAPSDQDDIWNLNKIEQLVKAINQGYDLVYAQESILWENGQKTAAIVYISPIDRLAWGNILKGHTCMFKRELVKLYKYSGILSFDYVLALYGCITKTALGLPDILTIWRRHSQSVTQCITLNAKKTSTKNKWIKMFISMMSFLKRGKLKSDGIQLYLKSRSEFLSYLLAEHEVKIDKEQLVLYIAILEDVAIQTFWSMLKASINNVRVHQLMNDYKKMNLIVKIRYICWSFRQPYIFWYDVHQVRHLG